MLLSPCGCRCGAGCVVGSLCVVLTGPCTGNPAGYVYVVKDADGNVVRTAGTYADGAGCVVDLPFGDYTVTATKEGCTSFAWSVSITECKQYTLTGYANCKTNSAVNIDKITGCYGAPLPGAVVTFSGPDGGSATTGSDGKAVWYTDKTGTFNYTVTHPSGRFKPASGTVTKPTVCTPVAIGAGLTPKDGYVCCGFLANLTPPSPYPIPTTLYVTDDDGTFPITLSPDTCTGDACVLREIDYVSDGVLSTCRCGSSTYYTPPIRSRQETAVLWTLRLNTSAPLALTYYFGLQNSVGGSLLYPSNCPAPSCTSDTRISWRTKTTCATIRTVSRKEDHGPSSYTLNSVMPLHITYNYASGNGYGPFPATPDPTFTGESYTSQAIVSETP
jgi:hypothetical protein